MANKQSLLPLMHGKYVQIRELEIQYHIFGHEGDYRPRIEYFHDAVRALGGDEDDGQTKHSRLAAERLAYDIEMLRYISARPATAGRGDHHFSTGDALVAEGMQGRESRMDRQIKQELGQHYKDYTVYFAAVMVDFMEDNILSRKEESDLLIQDCYNLESLLTDLAKGSIDVTMMMKAASQLEHDGLRHKIQSMLAQGVPDKQQLTNAVAFVQSARNQIKAEMVEMDKAGMRFVSSQLMVYEQSRDMVKKMAAQGMNIAGKHTAQTIGDHDKGRGSGRDY
jgi:hypothetical protein